MKLENYTKNNIMDNKNLKKTTRGRRFMSFIVDSVLWFIVGVVIFGLFGLIHEDLAKVMFGVYFIAYVVLQFVLMYRRSQTFGKFLLNIYVHDEKEKKRMGFVKLWLLRETLGKTLLLSAIPFLGILLWPIYALIDSLCIFRDDFRTAHDMIANSMVYDLPESAKRTSLFDFKTL